MRQTGYGSEMPTTLIKAF
jgi:long-chain-fatty-acid--CoA ligase ACSBG